MCHASEIERMLDRLYIGCAGATLRKEDRKKAAELAALFREIERAARRGMTLVDAAAGKGYVGVLAAALLAPARVIFIERDPARLELAREASVRAGVPGVRFSFHSGDVGDPALWPDAPDLVTALHACGPAADHVIDAAIAARARRVLLVPCCTPARERPGAARLGIPRHAAVRRAFLESLVAAERTLRLEAAGWQTEVVAFCPPAVTPYNLVFRARRVGEPGRMKRAAEDLARLSSL
jgi:threonine dehydrogenase-like Zn-dependent dehydrogenase